MGKAWHVVPALLCGLAAVPGKAARPHDAQPPAHAAAEVEPGFSRCGREPTAPRVDTSTIDRYNASVDRARSYEAAARTYDACVSRAATAQQTAISNEARSRIDAIQAMRGGLQRRIAGNFASLAAALHAGAPALRPPSASR